MFKLIYRKLIEHRRIHSRSITMSNSKVRETFSFLIPNFLIIMSDKVLKSYSTKATFKTSIELYFLNWYIVKSAQASSMRVWSHYCTSITPVSRQYSIVGTLRTRQYRTSITLISPRVALQLRTILPTQRPANVVLLPCYWHVTGAIMAWYWRGTGMLLAR